MEVGRGEMGMLLIAGGFLLLPVGMYLGLSGAVRICFEGECWPITQSSIGFAAACVFIGILLMATTEPEAGN